jgi:2-keto-4-pentenoate hydratase
MTTASSLAAPQRATRLSALLVEAHRIGGVLSMPPAEIAGLTMAEAYDAQALVAKTLGPPAGWKVGRKSPEAAPAYAPLYVKKLFSSGERFGCDAFRSWRVEAEIVFRLAHDLPGMARPYTRADMLDAIAAMIPAFELVDSRYATWPDLAPPFLLADGLSHGAMILGADVPFRPDLAFETIPVRLAIDDVVVIDQVGGNPVGDILDLLAWLATERATKGEGLRAGELVTTGSYTGMRPLPSGSRAKAAFEGIGTVEIARAG